MSLKTLVYAYVLGGMTFIPLVLASFLFIAFYTSVPVGDQDPAKSVKGHLEKSVIEEGVTVDPPSAEVEDNDLPRTRKGWLTVRRTFEEEPFDGSYVNLMRSFIDARSKDPKRSRPKDMWYVVLKGKVLYLYEDENMMECEAAIELGSHDIAVYPDGLLDGELFAKRNAICLRSKTSAVDDPLLSVTREMKLDNNSIEELQQELTEKGASDKKKEKAAELAKKRETARTEAMDMRTPWFLFVRSNVEMEDWYLSLVHASDEPTNTPTLAPLQAIFSSDDMAHLVATLDEQPDVIPMRWLNALLGRLFFSVYRTDVLEQYIINRLMRKLAKVKRPSFLSDIVVTEVSVGNTAPMLSKPMLKELTREGDASVEVRLAYKGEIRITIEATATINLGTRFKSYTVQLVLAAVLREIEGNLLVKIKRPPSNRIWYAFTQAPRLVLDVEPIVSDRQIKWSMILNQIEARLKEIIHESVVLPNMDDIAFFQSDGHGHRGGIWADAIRREKVPPTSKKHPDEEHLSNGTVYASSRTTEDVAAASSPELQPPPTKVQEERKATAAPQPEIVIDEPIMHSSTSLLKRRSTGGGSFSRDPTEPSDGTLDRGRPNELPDIRAKRSTSVPTDAERDPVLSDLSATATPGNGSEPQSAGPFTQGYPRSRSLSSTSDFTNPTSATPSSSSSHLSVGGKGAGPSSNSNSSTTSSFLATLRSRASDKQALSNSAKETMRKWGMNVNWSSLRRESGGQSVGSGSEGGNEDFGDGDVSHSDKGKQMSYAQIRAAVEERRERTPTPNSDGYGSDNTPSISVRTTGRERADDAFLSPTSDNMEPSRSSSSMSTQTDLPSSNRSLSTTRSAIEQPMLVPDNVEDAAETKPATPIHVQPTSARSMMVPGIHARHRGEVMSMGYTHSSPQPDETRNKSPAIQSVYRLWKAPTTTTSVSPEPLAEMENKWDGTPTPLAIPPPVAYTPTMGNTNSSSTAIRSVPPPLPPRSPSVATSGASTKSGAASPELFNSPASATLISQDESRRKSTDDSKHVRGARGAATVSTSGQEPTTEHSSTAREDLAFGMSASWKPPLPPRRSSTTTPTS